MTGIIRNNLDDEYLRINDAIIERNSENSDLLENSINKQSTDIFLPSPSESISFYKNVGINEQVPENIKITKELKIGTLLSFFYSQ